jgi:hypothetical protein
LSGAVQLPRADRRSSLGRRLGAVVGTRGVHEFAQHLLLHLLLDVVSLLLRIYFTLRALTVASCSAPTST